MIYTWVVFLGLVAMATFVQTLVCYTLWGLLQTLVFTDWMEPTFLKAFIVQLCIVLVVNLLRTRGN